MSERIKLKNTRSGYAEFQVCGTRCYVRRLPNQQWQSGLLRGKLRMKLQPTRTAAVRILADLIEDAIQRDPGRGPMATSQSRPYPW